MTAVSAPPPTPTALAQATGGLSAPVATPVGTFEAMLGSEEIDPAPRGKTVAAGSETIQGGKIVNDPSNGASKDDSKVEDAKGPDAKPTVLVDGTGTVALIAAIQIAPAVTPETPKAASETSGAPAALSTLIAAQAQPAPALTAANAGVASDQSFQDALAAAASPSSLAAESAAPLGRTDPAPTAAVPKAAGSTPIASTVQAVLSPEAASLHPVSSVPAIAPAPQDFSSSPVPAAALDLAVTAQVQPSTPAQSPAAGTIEATSAPAPRPKSDSPTADASADATAGVIDPAQPSTDLQAKQATIAAGADKAATTLAAPVAPSATAAAKTETSVDQPSADKDAARVAATADKPVVAARRNGTNGDPKQSGADQGGSGNGDPAQAAAQPDNSGGAFTLTQSAPASSDGSPDAVAGQAASGAGASTAAVLAASIAAAAENAGAGARRTRLEVRLDEDDLGRIDVRLDISQDGRVSTRLTIDRPDTLAMLRNDASELTKNLQQAGFTMNGGGLSFELRDGSGQGFSGRDQRQGSVQHVTAAQAEDDLVVSDQVTAAYRGPRSATAALDVRV